MSADTLPLRDDGTGIVLRPRSPQRRRLTESCRWHTMHHRDAACAWHGVDRGQLDMAADERRNVPVH
jgi:hypothetical protein